MKKTISFWVILLFSWNTFLPPGYTYAADGDEDEAPARGTVVNWEGDGPAPLFNVLGRTMFEVCGVPKTMERDDLQDVKRFHMKKLRSDTPEQIYLAKPVRYSASTELVAHIWDAFSETRTRDEYKKLIATVEPELQQGHGEVHAQLMHAWKEHRYRNAEYFDPMTKEQRLSEFKRFIWTSEWRNLYSRPLIEAIQKPPVISEDKPASLFVNNAFYAWTAGAVVVAALCAAITVGYGLGSWRYKTDGQEQLESRVNVDNLTEIHASPYAPEKDVLDGARSRGDLFEAQFGELSEIAP